MTSTSTETKWSDFWDPSRPLFTIAVLVVGVVGGLVVVITVVYFYRFCLKKRPPLTTTSKPDLKREQIRSTLPAHCRPLPLPINNVYQNTVQLMQGDARTAILKKESLSYKDSVQSAPPPMVVNVARNSIVDARPFPQKQLSETANDDVYAFNPSPHQMGAHSAERLSQEEMRDGQPMKRRQLPSTQHLEAELIDSSLLRRQSTLLRTNALMLPGAPIKQNSSPLPQERKMIYSRGHHNSRSWNPEMSYEVDPDFPPQQPSGHSYPYYNNGQLYPAVPAQFIPRIVAPTNTPATLAVRQISRQAKSFDDRGERPAWSEKRSQSESEQRVLERQRTHEEALLPETFISRECQFLWAARGHLEQLKQLGIEDPSSASTSFESNTEAISSTPRGSQVTSVKDANEKRSKYKSLLLQRKYLSTTDAVSSLDSTISNDSTTQTDRETVLMGESADSAEMEQRRLLLMNRDTTGPSHLGRDYSVDATTNALFQEFSRIDPKYSSFDGQFPLVPSSYAYPPPSLPSNRNPAIQKWETFDHSSITNKRQFPTRQTSVNHDYQF